jgi:hypothetical protein
MKIRPYGGDEFTLKENKEFRSFLMDIAYLISNALFCFASVRLWTKLG